MLVFWGLGLSVLCALVDVVLYFYLKSRKATPPITHLYLGLPIVLLLTFLALAYLFLSGIGLPGHEVPYSDRDADVCSPSSVVRVRSAEREASRQSVSVA